MQRPNPHLRNILTGITAAVAGLALIIAAVLMVITRRLHETTVTMAASIESIRLAEEAEIGLLLYQRAATDNQRKQIATTLRRQLADAGTYVITGAESRALEEAVMRVERFLRAWEDGRGDVLAVESLAYEALERLIDINVADSRALQASAARWDRTADVLGLAVSLVVVIIAASLVWWLHRKAFRPIFLLGQAMERFGRGDREARAPETGPPELRDMIIRFNQMASMLAAHQGAQAAFIGGVAHDLRNPLSVLLLQLEFLRPDQPLPDETVVRRTVRMIRHQLTRLDRMLGDLVDMTRIESGRLELQLSDHDVRTIVNEVAELFRAASPQNPVRVAIPSEPVILRCDRVRLEQVVTNLVSNAVKYSPSRGGILIGVHREGDEAVIAVTDRGIGISASDQRQLFEPFRRVGLSTENIPGAGLGLFVVRRIVEAHGGRITVESEPGKGATFRVFLPVAALEGEEGRGKREEEKPQSARAGHTS